MTTPALVLPTRLVRPQVLQVRVAGGSIAGPSNLVNEQSLTEISGGGRVSADFGPIRMQDRALILAWRRLVGGAKGGSVPIVVPFADRRHQPVNPRYTGADLVGLDTWVADLAAWTAEEVTATTTADADLGATSLTFTLTTPIDGHTGAHIPLLGGEWLSIAHATVGWRAYQTWRVSSGGLGSGDSTTVLFNPPLREAVPSGTALNLERPRCMMQLVGDGSEQLEMLKIGTAKASLVEWPGDLP